MKNKKEQSTNSLGKVPNTVLGKVKIIDKPLSKKDVEIEYNKRFKKTKAKELIELINGIIGK